MVIAGVVLAAVFAWFASALPPFTLRSYLVVVGAGAFLVALTLLPYGRANKRSSTFPIAGTVITGLAVALELVSLGLGGRQRMMPTLSTMLDHLIVDRPLRFTTAALWLFAGLVGALRRAPT